MRQSFEENSKKLIYENRNSAKQSIKAQQEKAMPKGGTTRRRSEAVQRRTETDHD